MDGTMDISIIIAIAIFVVIACVNIVSRILLKGKVKRLTEKASLLVLIVYVVILFGIAFLTTEVAPAYNTPEEAFHVGQNESGELLYKIQGDDIAVFVVGDQGVTLPFVSVKKEGKWCVMGTAEGFGDGVSNGIEFTVAFSNQCDEAVVYVDPRNNVIESLSDSCDSQFQTQRVKLSNGTYYNQYYAILPKLDENYTLEINGDKQKPHYLPSMSPKFGQ